MPKLCRSQYSAFFRSALRGRPLICSELEVQNESFNHLADGRLGMNCRSCAYPDNLSRAQPIKIPSIYDDAVNLRYLKFVAARQHLSNDPAFPSCTMKGTIDARVITQVRTVRRTEERPRSSLQENRRLVRRAKKAVQRRPQASFLGEYAHRCGFSTRHIRLVSKEIADIVDTELDHSRSFE